MRSFVSSGAPSGAGTVGPTGPTGPTGATGPTGPAGSANISGTLNRVVKFTPDGTTGGDSGITDDGTTVSTSQAVTITNAITERRDSIGTTRTQGIRLANTTASGTQYSPSLELFGQQAATAKGYQFTVIPSASTVQLEVRVDPGTGTFGSAFSHSPLDASMFVNAFRAQSFVCVLSIDGFQFTDGSGMRRQSGADVSIDSYGTSLPGRLRGSRSTGNTGAVWRIEAVAGTLTAGYWLDCYDGARRFGIDYQGRFDYSATPTLNALGQLAVNVTTGRPIAYIDGGTKSLATLTDIGGGAIQSGRATLVSGVTSAISATITASSRIVGFLADQVTASLSVKYAALDVDRVVGAPGSFKITALVAAGTINVDDGSALDWIVIG